MNLGYLIENCSNRNAQGFVCNYKPCSCKSCKTSEEQFELGIKLAKQHTYGTKCPLPNNCSRCCETKHILRIANHVIYNQLNCTRKCEACRDKFRYLDNFKKNLVKVLYVKVVSDGRAINNKWIKYK